MKCPFELPAEKYPPMKIIRDKNMTYICDYKDEDYADYILLALNSHKKLTDALAKKFNEVCERILSDLYPKLKASHKKLKEALEEAGSDFYYLHRHSEDAHDDSYKFMNKIEQVLKEMEKP